MERRRASRLGMTSDKKSYVKDSLVQQLAGMGFPRAKAIRSGLCPHKQAPAAWPAGPEKLARSYRKAKLLSLSVVVQRPGFVRGVPSSR